MVSGSGSVCAQRFGIEVDDTRNQAAVGKEAAIHSERSTVQARALRPRSARPCDSCALREYDCCGGVAAGAGPVASPPRVAAWLVVGARRRCRVLLARVLGDEPARGVWAPAG